MLIIKLSGKALDATAQIQALFQALKGKRAVIVHGGGVKADALLKKFDFPVQRIDGLRVTLPEPLYYLTGALGGSCSKYLQADAIRAGLKAQALMATDLGFLKAVRLDKKYGEVGTVVPGDATFINYLLDKGITPVICSLGIDEHGDILNINADDVAEAAAQLLQAKLVYLSDVAGVLDGEGQVIEHIDSKECERLIAAGVITAGMTVKVKAALTASSRTHNSVIIGSIYDRRLPEFVQGGPSFGTEVSA